MSDYRCIITHYTCVHNALQMDAFSVTRFLYDTTHDKFKTIIITHICLSSVVAKAYSTYWRQGVLENKQ